MEDQEFDSDSMNPESKSLMSVLVKKEMYRIVFNWIRTMLSTLHRISQWIFKRILYRR